MPLPTNQLGTLRPDLNDAMTEFDLTANQEGMIASLVAPPIDVDQQSGTYPRIKIKQLLRNASVERTSEGNYPRDTYEFENDSYATKEYGIEQTVDGRDAARFKNYMDAEAIAASLAQSRILQAREERTAALIFNTGTWNTAALTTAVAVPWSTYATAVPITNVDAARIKFRNNSGRKPNALIMEYTVFIHLRNCQQIIDRIAAAGAGDKVKANDITKSMLAQVFDVDFVIVADNMKNTANEGQAAALSGVWDPTMCMLARVATSNNIKEPCIARTLHWTEDGSMVNGAMESYQDPRSRKDIIRCRHDVQEKVVFTEMGHLLTAVA